MFLKSIISSAPVLLLAVIASALPAVGQDVCLPPAALTNPGDPNIFTPEQEIKLGEEIAKRALRGWRITDDPSLTGYLNNIGGRLISQLPSNSFSFRFRIVDSGYPDAFALPGGQIYISRKMLLFARSDEEVASVLAHEIGHVATHQGAADLTFLIRTVLGVAQVGDRQDLSEKLDLLERNGPRDPELFRQIARKSSSEQGAADQTAIYLLGRAGYSTQVFVSLFDQLAETGGRTGNWFSDFLHLTKPNELRLRELQKVAGTLPPACQSHPPGEDRTAFLNWQRAAVEFDAWEQPVKERPHGVLAEIHLQPAMGVNSDFDTLRFSPDGRNLIAASHSRVHVLTRDPLRYQFSVAAPFLEEAHFTPDSRSLVITSKHLRIERWDVASGKRTTAFEPVVLSGCRIALASPDGGTLACLTYKGIMLLKDVATGESLLEKKGFEGWCEAAFSPDGRYFLAACNQHAVAFDMSSNSEVSLGGELAGMSRGFSFVGSDSVAAGSTSGGAVSLLSFPGGKTLAQLPLSRWAGFRATAQGDSLLVSETSGDNYKVLLLNLQTQKFVLRGKDRACDIYGQIFASRTPEGAVALFDVKSLSETAHLTVPGSALRATSAAAPPDLRWLAIAAKDQGGIWDLTTGQRVLQLKQFKSGWFSTDGWFYADFPRLEDSPHEFVRVPLDGKQSAATLKVGETQVAQAGPLYLVTIPHTKAGALNTDRGDLLSAIGGLARAFQPCRSRFADFDAMDCDVTVEMHDVRNGKSVWSRRFSKDAPRIRMLPERGKVLFTWPATSATAQEEIRKNSSLREQFRTHQAQEPQQLLEVLDASSGTLLESKLVEGIHTVWSVIGGEGEPLVGILQSRNGVIVRALSMASSPLHIPGQPLAVSSNGSLLALKDDDGQLLLYNLPSGKKLDEQPFAERLLDVWFSNDSARLLALTDAQTAYVLRVPEGSKK